MKRLDRCQSPAWRMIHVKGYCRLAESLEEESRHCAYWRDCFEARRMLQTLLDCHRRVNRFESGRKRQTPTEMRGEMTGVRTALVQAEATARQ